MIVARDAAWQRFDTFKRREREGTLHQDRYMGAAVISAGHDYAALCWQVQEAEALAAQSQTAGRRIVQSRFAAGPREGELVPRMYSVVDGGEEIGYIVHDLRDLAWNVTMYDTNGEHHSRHFAAFRDAQQRAFAWAYEFDRSLNAASTR